MTASRTTTPGTQGVEVAAGAHGAVAAAADHNALFSTPAPRTRFSLLRLVQRLLIARRRRAVYLQLSADDRRLLSDIGIEQHQIREISRTLAERSVAAGVRRF